MASTNIFAMLQGSDDEEDFTKVLVRKESKEDGKQQAQQAKKVVEEKKVIPGAMEQKKRVRTKKDESEAPSQVQQGGNDGFIQQKESINQRGKVEREVKSRDIVEKPRLQDRHSQDDRKEGKAMKKGGAGKGNWGNYKDEEKYDQKEVEPKLQEELQDQTTEQQQQPKKVDEEEQVMGLKEYREMQKKRDLQQQSNNQQKKELDIKSIEKEGLLKVTIRKEIQNDDYNSKVKKNKDTFASQINTENKDMLGLRTGFITKDTQNQKQDRNNFKKNQKGKKIVDDEGNFPTLG